MERFSMRLLLLGPALVIGCGGAEVKQQEVVDARAAVLAVEKAEADENPEAAMHLRLAQEQLQAAEKMQKEDEPEQARLLLDRAKMDAELALQIARTEQLKAQAREAWSRVEELRENGSR
jgi:hypothetical protein